VLHGITILLNWTEMKLYGDDVFRTGASHQFLSYCGTAWATDELWCVCV